MIKCRLAITLAALVAFLNGGVEADACSHSPTPLDLSAVHGSARGDLLLIAILAGLGFMLAAFRWVIRVARTRRIQQALAESGDLAPGKGM
jgi:hypothetical protein